jgi:hypothetical protein
MIMERQINGEITQGDGLGLVDSDSALLSFWSDWAKR